MQSVMDGDVLFYLGCSYVASKPDADDIYFKLMANIVLMVKEFIFLFNEYRKCMKGRIHFLSSFDPLEMSYVINLTIAPGT